MPSPTDAVTTPSPTRAGAAYAGPVQTEHLLIYPERDVAEEVAIELRTAGFADARVVREALSGEDDSEAHEWAVHVLTPTDGSYAVQLQALAERHDGWYDSAPAD